MAQGFVYDPSQEISQQFKQTAGGVGNVFAQVIAQRQQDFQFAEKMMENIEALKKDVNLLGQQEVSGEVNNLLKEAGSSIVKSGKLDYSKLGEIRQKVSDIKDLKAGYNVYAKNLETLVNLAAQSKDEIVSVSGLYNQLAGLAKDKDLMKRPNDLSARMRNIYDDNRDADVVVRKNIGSVLGTEKLAQTVEDKSGRYFVQGETYKGATIDPKTRKYNIPQESIDLAYNSLAINNPDLITFLRKKSGVDPGIMNDKQLFAEYMMRSAGTPMSKMEKSEADLRRDVAEASVAETKARVAPTQAELERQKTIAEIGALGRRGQGGSASETVIPAQQSMYEDQVQLPSAGGKQRFMPVTAAPLGKNVKISIGDNQAIVTDIAKSKTTGTIWAKVLKKDGELVLDDNQLSGAQQTWVKVKNPSTFKKTLERTIQAGGFSKEDAAIGIQSVNNVFASGVRKSQAPSQPKASQKIIVTQAQVNEAAKAQGVSPQEYSKYLMSLGTYQIK